MDTRLDLENARARGGLARIGWLWNTLGGVAHGACISHVHAIKTPVQMQTITAGNAVIAWGGDNPGSKNSMWLAIVLSQVGALIVGHMGAELFFPLWIEGGIHRLGMALEEYGASIGVFMGLAPTALKLGLLITGPYLVFTHRVRSTIKLLPYVYWGQLVFLCWLAGSASFMNWTLKDIGREVVPMVEVMEEYPLVKQQMGLPDGLVSDLTFSP